MHKLFFLQIVLNNNPFSFLLEFIKMTLIAKNLKQFPTVKLIFAEGVITNKSTDTGAIGSI